MDRTIAPEIIMPTKIDLLAVEETNLQNNLKIYSLDGCSEPVLNLTIVLKSGKYYQSKKMVAGYVASLLMKGTKNRTSLQIAEELDFLGASLTAQTGMFTATVSLSCMSKNLKEILPIVKDVLTNSIFPQNELDIEKRKQIQNLKINEEKTGYLASIKFNAAIVGENHNCGYSPKEEYINAINREDLIAFYKKRFYLNKEAFIVLSGDIDVNILKLIDQYIGSIKIENEFEQISDPFLPMQKKEMFLPKKNSVQASIRVGMNFIDIHHEDYLDFEIVNRVLGGFFGSRLMKNIREDKGYTYGIYSFLGNYENGSYFCIATDVGIQYKEATLKEISIEINRLKTELISEKELQMVKNYHKGRIMKSVDGALRYANVLSNQISLNLEKTRINNQLQAVENITTERILFLAKKYLIFEDMYKIVVG